MTVQIIEETKAEPPSSSINITISAGGSSHVSEEHLVATEENEEEEEIVMVAVTTNEEPEGPQEPVPEEVVKEEAAPPVDDVPPMEDALSMEADTTKEETLPMEASMTNEDAEPMENGTVIDTPTVAPEKATKSDGAVDATESEEELPPRRLTRNRVSLLHVEESDTESDKGGRQRTTRQRAAKQQQNGSKGRSNSKPDVNNKRKKGSSDAAKGGGSGGPATSDSDDDDDGTPGEYIPVEVGDCVLLDSGDPENHYIALVSSVQRSQNFVKGQGTFTAQWYYKPDDIRQEVRNLIEGGVLEGEVFLSPHKDKNSIDAVVGLCNVVSPDEYEEVQGEIKRGFREKTKPYYICRFKYYPGRPIKKALEVVKNDAIRSGLGPMKPKIGDQYQAAVPEFVEPAPKPTKEVGDAATEIDLPWKLPQLPKTSRRYRQSWSPLVLEHQSLAFHQFQQMLAPLKFAVGNVLKVFRRDSGSTPGHVRCVVLEYVPSDHVQICLSTGQVKTVLPSQLCSPLGDDVAMSHFYRSRFNLCEAIRECADEIVRAQTSERDAFRKEVVEFSQLAFLERQDLATAAAIEATRMGLTEEEDDQEEEQDEGASAIRKRRK